MIAVLKQEKIIIGKYGKARLNYIKQHKKCLYTELMMTGTLYQHLAEIDKTANKRVNEIICEMAKKKMFQYIMTEKWSNLSGLV